jgi:hydrogenase-4 component F
MNGIAVGIVALPAVLSAVCFLVPARLGARLTALGGLVTAAAVVALAVDASAGRGSTDALSAVFLLPVAVVYGTVGLYVVWYVPDESPPNMAGEAYRREFLALTNAFACAEAVVPLLTNMLGLWIALEVTTIVAALFVRLQGTDAALEAAWKYILIASCGLAMGLIGILVLYASAIGPLGPHHAPQWSSYVAVAARLDPDAVRLAFIFALIGFGTKMGLAPMHTWLPDAHGAGPTPTSAMLSGILLSDALYAIVRFAGIANAAVGTGLVRGLLIILGVLSLFLAAFFLLRQSDVKRMLAYSSIEHMGIVACGLGFGVPLAVAGALLHTINHAASKSVAFFSAGRLAHRFETGEIAGMRGGVAALPYSGTIFVLAGLSLAGMPPFGIFRSELMILAGGFRSPAWGVTIVVLGLLLVAFAGIVRWINAIGTGEPPHGVPRGERGVAPIAAMVLGLIVVLGLGLAVPPFLATLLERATALAGFG